MIKKSIIGKNIILRDAEVNDAEFILSARLDPKKNKFLNVTTNDLKQQMIYLKKYKNTTEKMWYFIIENKNNIPLGTVRIYDIKNNSFSWGSWLIIHSAPKTTAIESALLIYEYAFYQLGFTKSHFEVRKENQRVVEFHKRMGAEVVSETDIDYLFNYNVSLYGKIRGRYAKFLV